MPFFCYRKTIRSITTDNGSEFCAHKLISNALAPKGSKNPNLVFFADSYSSWQKGAIENANKLIRQYIPKGTDFSSLTDAFILKIQIKSTEDLAKNSILDPLARFSSSKLLILHLPVESRMWGLWQCICRKSPFLCIQERIIPTKWLTLRKEVSSIFRKMNVTNSIIKFVSSLAQKKYRDKEGCFVAEGTKCVRDTWQHFDCRMIIATQNWYDTFGNSSHLGKLYIANRGQMQRMSQFATASEVIAVYNIPQPDLEPKAEQDGINIVLDGIQDPGNLGTIIRLADWYGIRNIFCSKQTVDVYNHKVVQATMGAISRVKVTYCDLEALIAGSSLPVYGTTLDGDNIYSTELASSAFVVFGNEGNGMSERLKSLATKNLCIPSGTANGEGSESLNVSIAAAITISEFCRNRLK